MTFAKRLDFMRTRTIVTVGFQRNPSTIIGRVPFIVIDSVEGEGFVITVFQRPRPKLLTGFPFGAYGNSSPAISPIIGMAGIGATLNHIGMNYIKSRSHRHYSFLDKWGLLRGCHRTQVLLDSLLC